MKIYILFYVLTLSCLNSVEKEKSAKIDSGTFKSQIVNAVSTSFICNFDYDSTLVRLAKSFNATNIDLRYSMPEELNRFMIQVDTNCLRKQKMYPFFINTILAKLALYQLKCCHQHYELRATSKGGPLGAAIIVNEFERMAGFQNKPIDMLSSQKVEMYIRKMPELINNYYLNNIIVKIRREEDRINKGPI